MATPPTRVSYNTPAVGFGSTATPKTTPTFDVQAGDLLVFIASGEDSPATIGTPSASGGSVTWTSRQSIVVTNYCTMYLWTGAVGATATGITVSASGVSSREWSFGVTVWRNHGGVGVTGKANISSGAPSLALTTSANSAVQCGSDDWNAADGTSRTWRTVNGSAMTESLYFRDSTRYTVYAGYAPDTGAAGTTTVGLSAPTGQKYSIVGVEILGAAGGSTNVSLTGAVVGSITSAPAGTVSATSVTNVSLTGATVGSVTAAAAGSASLVSNVTASGAVVGSVASSPAGTLSTSSSVALTGAVTGSVTAAPAGTLSVSSVGNVSLTGQTVGSVTGAPAGTISTSSNVSLAGAVAGSITSAPAGSLTISSVGDVSLVGQPVGSITSAPAGTVSLVSVGNVNLTGVATGSLTGAPAGSVTTVTNVSLTGLVASSTTQALAGLLSVVSSSSVNLTGAAVGSASSAPAGSLVIASAGDGAPVDHPRAFLTVTVGAATLTSPVGAATLTVTDARGTLTTPTSRGTLT